MSAAEDVHTSLNSFEDRYVALEQSNIDLRQQPTEAQTIDSHRQVLLDEARALVRACAEIIGHEHNAKAKLLREKTDLQANLDKEVKKSLKAEQHEHSQSRDKYIQLEVVLQQTQESKKRLQAALDIQQDQISKLQDDHAELGKILQQTQESDDHYRTALKVEQTDNRHYKQMLADREMKFEQTQRSCKRSEAALEAERNENRHRADRITQIEMNAQHLQASLEGFEQAVSDLKTKLAAEVAQRVETETRLQKIDTDREELTRSLQGTRLEAEREAKAKDDADCRFKQGLIRQEALRADVDDLTSRLKQKADDCAQEMAQCVKLKQTNVQVTKFLSSHWLEARRVLDLSMSVLISKLVGIDSTAALIETLSDVSSGLKPTTPIQTPDRDPARQSSPDTASSTSAVVPSTPAIERSRINSAPQAPNMGSDKSPSLPDSSALDNEGRTKQSGPREMPMHQREPFPFGPPREPVASQTTTAPSNRESRHQYWPDPRSQSSFPPQDVGQIQHRKRGADSQDDHRPEFKRRYGDSATVPAVGKEADRAAGEGRRTNVVGERPPWARKATINWQW